MKRVHPVPRSVALVDQGRPCCAAIAALACDRPARDCAPPPVAPGFLGVERAGA